MKNKQILIVGGTGYLGTHLVKVLSPDNNIFITGTSAGNRDNYFHIDFRNRETFSTLAGRYFDIIFILASSITGIGTTALTNGDLDTNVYGYAAFLEFLKANKLTNRILYTSSMTVYGLENKLPVPENGVCSPVHVYGLSKYIAEKLTSFLSSNSDIQSLIVRLPGIYGGNREGGMIYNVLKKCLNNEKVIVDIEHLAYWETIEINDLIAYLVELLSQYKWEKQHDVYNISYGCKVDIIQTVFLIKKLVNSNNEIIVTGKKEYVDFYLDNSKITDTTGLSFSFESSLSHYINKFL